MRLLPFLFLLCILTACRDAPADESSEPRAATEPTAPPTPPLAFDSLAYRDSVALRRGGPYYTYGLNTLRATGGPDELRQLINDTLAARILQRPLPADSSFEQGVRYYTEAAFADYLAQPVDEGLLEESAVPYSRDEQLNTELVYRSDSLLVLAQRYYGYYGGAHGNHFTTLLPFAVYPPRRLTYADLFAPGNEPALSQLLTERARETGASIYVDTVPVTDNVAPLPEGLRFLYDPYAIGPYAAGEIAIDLPYAWVRQLMRQEARPLVAGF